LAQSAAERGNFDLSLSLPEKITPLLTDLEQTIYRVTQEALENIVHHANAENVLLTLTENADEICLTIEDDGIGFKIDSIDQEGHYGLAGIRERAQIAGAKLTVTSRPDQGTRIELKLEGHRK
jgi:signal transduction histidine kinase